MKEIERKFLARVTDPVPMDPACDQVLESIQGYLASGARHELRIRRLVNRFPEQSIHYYLAVKFGAGLVRHEFELEVPRWLGRRLLKRCAQVIRKTRWVVAGWDVDFFWNPWLHPLVLAEIELLRPDEPLPGAPRGLHLLEEVTGRPEYANKNLVRQHPSGLRTADDFDWMHTELPDD